MTTLKEAMEADLAQCFFNVCGHAETIVYKRDATQASIPAVIGAADIDQLLEINAVCDKCTIYVYEESLHELFERTPERGDYCIVTLPATLTQVLRTETWEVREMERDPVGVWKLECEKRIRIVP